MFRSTVGRLRLLLPATAIALLAAPAAASAWMPAPVQFEQRVNPLAGASHAAGGQVVTRKIRTSRRFDVVGLQWSGAPTARLEVRVSRPGGGWSRWGSAAAADDGPDQRQAGAAHATFSDPIWAGGADRIQIRLSRPVRGLRLRLINTTGSATPADRARTRAAVARRGPFGAAPKLPATSAAAPPIIPRSAWGADRCTPRVPPAFGSVRVAYVHHTESLNGYSRAGAASMVLGICLFHRNTRGWNDIGYDFLVDRYGRVFEGRAGGVDSPVIGAHAGGFNSESTGVSVIGSFSSVRPTAAAMSALAKLLAWKLALHGVPAEGKVTVTSAGGSSTNYPAGARVTVNRIAGHRDVDATACPGNALYRLLPSLRSRVARLEGPISQLTIAPAAGEVRYGQGTTVSGRLTPPGGAPAAGARIELQRIDGGQPQTVATAETAADGSWTAQLPAPATTTALRAEFAGDQGRPGVISAAAYVAVVPEVTLAAEQATIARGGKVVVNGTVHPAKRRVVVVAYLERPDGSERRAASRALTVSKGSFRGGIQLKKAGTYRLVATVTGDSSSGAGASAPISIQVTP